MAFFWTQRQDIGPDARHGHALAYDEQSSRTLLTGGSGVGTFFGDTWAWDGEAWTQVADMGPSERTGHAMAYDGSRGRIVLFGGIGKASVTSDTWEWDGDAWMQVADMGPSARHGHSLAYDTLRSRTVLFGGETAATGMLGDTWEWDGHEWLQVADTGPSARAGHAMCYEAGAARAVLFGGSTTSDTWCWDGTTWTQLNDIGPAPCTGAGLVPGGTGVVLFGGIEQSPVSGKLSGLTWGLDGTSWTERQNMGPAARTEHAMAHDTKRGSVVLFGGCTAAPATAAVADLRSDTWELPVGPSVPDGGVPPGISLVGFSVSPNTVSPNDTFGLIVGLNQPTPSTVNVDITIDGADSGGIQILAGLQTESVLGTPAQIGLGSGAHSLTATLGPVSLQAQLNVT